MRQKAAGKLSKQYLRVFFSVVVLVDLLITLLLCVCYSGIQISSTAQYTVSQLEQACTSTDILYESMTAIVNQVFADTDTTQFLSSTKIDRIQESQTAIALRKLRAANPYFRYITLYNNGNRRFVSTAYAGEETVLDAQSLYEILGDRESACFLRQIGAEYNVQENKSITVYTFLFPVRISGKEGDRPDLVVIDVNERYFDQVLSNIRIFGSRQDILLTGEDGELIVEMSASAEDEEFSIVADPAPVKLNEARGEGASSGSASVWGRQGGGPQFGCWATASSAGWVIWNVLPYGTILQNLWSVLLLTLLLSLLTLGFGYAISHRASAQLYAPIRELYDSYVSQESRKKKGNELKLLSDAFFEMYSKVDQLEQGLIRTYDDSKGIYLRYLLIGEKRKVEKSLPVYRHLGIDLASPYFGVALLECTPQLPDSQEDREQRNANLFISYYALENITEELVNAVCRMEFVRMEENRFALLLHLEKNEFPQAIREALETAGSVMAREFQLDVTACVGGVVASWMDLNLAYEQALIALNRKSPSHYGKVFAVGEGAESLSRDLYYNGLRGRLAEHLRAEDLDQCAVEFDLAISAMQDINFRAVLAFFQHTLMSLLDDFSPAFDRDGEYFPQLLSRLDKLEKCQNVQALREEVLSFLSDLCHGLAMNRRGTNQDAVQKAKAYIDKNYADPDLSLRMLAELVDLSPAYLGKIFTMVTTFSFNDYLNNVRTGKAAELLSTTKLPISRISEEVGILNTNYFYSVFKKRYGTTPATYRKDVKSRKKEEPAPPGEDA